MLELHNLKVAPSQILKETDFQDPWFLGPGLNSRLQSFEHVRGVASQYLSLERVRKLIRSQELQQPFGVIQN